MLPHYSVETGTLWVERRCCVRGVNRLRMDQCAALHCGTKSAWRLLVRTLWKRKQNQCVTPILKAKILRLDVPGHIPGERDFLGRPFVFFPFAILPGWFSACACELRVPLANHISSKLHESVWAVGILCLMFTDHSQSWVYKTHSYMFMWVMSSSWCLRQREPSVARTVKLLAEARKVS